MMRSHKVFAYLFTSTGLFSMILLLAGEWHTAGALWVVILCFLPAMWVTMGTSYISLKIFCATALITQVITVPVFYIQEERYAFGGHRPFGFTAWDALPIFLPLGLFLWLTAILVKISQGLIGRPAHRIDIPRGVGRASIASALLFRSAKRQTPFVIGILLLMTITLPVKFWMFDMGIGIVGAPPPQLPFRLSGALFYLSSYIIPLVIGYFYIRTKRHSLLLALTISVYALLIGLSSSSKGVVLLTTAPVIAFSWLDRRWTILGISGLLAGFGVIIAARSREIVHISDGLMAGSFTELGVLGTLLGTLALVEWSPEILLDVVGIAGRVDGFQGLLLASQFNPDAVGGAWALLLKSINGGWVDLGHDAMHMEYLGYTIPEGYYNIAASLNAWMLMATNKYLVMVLPFAIYVAVVLVILEKMIMRAVCKYRQPLPLVRPMLFFATLWFYTGPGTLEFQTIFTMSAIFGMLPAIRFGRGRVAVKDALIYSQTVATTSLPRASE